MNATSKDFAALTALSPVQEEQQTDLWKETVNSELKMAVNSDLKCCSFVMFSESIGFDFVGFSSFLGNITVASHR